MCKLDDTWKKQHNKKSTLWILNLCVYNYAKSSFKYSRHHHVFLEDQPQNSHK